MNPWLLRAAWHKFGWVLAVLTFFAGVILPGLNDWEFVAMIFISAVEAIVFGVTVIGEELPPNPRNKAYQLTQQKKRIEALEKDVDKDLLDVVTQAEERAYKEMGLKTPKEQEEADRLAEAERAKKERKRVEFLRRQELEEEVKRKGDAWHNSLMQVSEEIARTHSQVVQDGPWHNFVCTDQVAPKEYTCSKCGMKIWKFDLDYFNKKYCTNVYTKQYGFSHPPESSYYEAKLLPEKGAHSHNYLPHVFLSAHGSRTMTCAKCGTTIWEEQLNHYENEPCKGKAYH